jgi:hypothetical protein
MTKGQWLVQQWSTAPWATFSFGGRPRTLCGAQATSIAATARSSHRRGHWFEPSIAHQDTFGAKRAFSF